MSSPARSPAVPSARVPVVDGLRGLASLAVCWYHLVFANGAFLGPGIIAATMRDSARNAWVGVEVFFVISGFVIPLALYRARYTPRAYGSFLLKRILRLDPPYLVSVVLCVSLWWLAATVPHGHGEPFRLSLSGLLLHIGYLNAFFGQGWLNPVYWTLAIEFQYYLGIGVLFWAVAHPRLPVRLAAFAVLAALALAIPSPNLVFRYLFVFMLGMATFQRLVNLIGTPLYIALLLALTAGAGVTLGPMVAAVALITAVIIITVRRPLPVLGWFGTISYSLYLVHVPVGGRLMNIGLAHAHTATQRLLVLFVALAAVLGAAWMLYRFVERPAQRWSSGLRYRRERGQPAVQSMPAGTATGIAEP